MLVPLLGGAGLLWLLMGNRHYLLRVVPIVLAGTALLTGAAWFLTEKVWNLWGAPLEKILYLWAWLAFAGLVLAAFRILATRRWRAASLSLAAGLLTVLAAATLINLYFGKYPTVGNLFGNPGVTVETLPELAKEDPSAPSKLPPTPVKESAWTPPADMPAHGKVVVAKIASTASGLATSDAYLYLPPAYLVAQRPNLPVLVLLHGVPGHSLDWLEGGQLTTMMDDYAARHKGLAPVVVMPDVGGNFAPNPPLCLDTKFGKSATYLSQDVPQWIKSTLNAGNVDNHQWALAGFSYGGTCTLQLAANFPSIYPTFIDISGEDQPTINAGYRTLIQTYFDGDEAAFRRQNALDVIRTRKYPQTAGIITVGALDSYYRPQGLRVYDAARSAGMNVQLKEVLGAHNWQAWRAGLEDNLDWLTARLGITG